MYTHTHIYIYLVLSRGLQAGLLKECTLNTCIILDRFSASLNYHTSPEINVILSI